MQHACCGAAPTAKAAGASNPTSVNTSNILAVRRYIHEVLERIGY